ncbi:uncharacterized protein J4E88_005713 [Alternaria novae-zelandiae]|uniref:uncharacterized protein n=1 Tax=Alternaria novae-zelandiae TaxID=430562 RepID=UPI0020C464EF|nr:uncharacterized protein J4E88_005713 [Alternaria novae-zelandiae]KAI4681206.1 hypothetical protein J4E88_005713 [Alternaria novae-zelandiae]
MNGPPNPPEQLDYYEILGVNERASYATIERCHKRLQAAYHPDSRRVGATPNTEQFQNVGIAWDTLKSDGKRAKYDKSYPRIRNQWDVYRTNLAKWNADQREIEQRHARAAARRKKVDEEKMEIERGKQKVLEEKAKEATRRRMERMETEKALLAKEAKAKEQIRQREQEAILARERLQEEIRQQGLKQAKEDARIKADWERAQKERNVTKGNDKPQHSPDEDQALRERWRLKQGRTKEQAAKAERANILAAEERLRQQQNETQSFEAEARQKHEEAERRAAKQRAAEEREALVIAAAQERQARAAQDRLDHGSSSLKRSAPEDYEEPQALHSTKQPRQDKKISTSLKKHLAREQARRKHSEKLRDVGGPGNEERLRDVSIDLGWKHVEYQNEPCPQCYTKKSAAQFGLWECPDGGALRCRPCLAALSVFGA